MVRRAAIQEDIAKGMIPREVAVKIIDITKLTTRAISLIYEEVCVMRELKGNINIINMYDYYERPRDRLVVMELMPGGELFDSIASKGAHNEHDTRVIFKQILSGLQYMHSKEIMHRDMKPENLLLSSKDDTIATVKICDFGMATHVVGETSGELCGTGEYMSPEMIERKPYGTQVDMWGAGIMLYVLLCGYLPFQEMSTSELRQSISRDNVVFHADYWSKVSKDAKQFVLKLLMKNSKDRLTASQALNDPWMLHEETHLTQFQRSNDTQRLFRRHNARRKIMGVARAIIATNRMKKLVENNLHTHNVTTNVVNPMRS